ncbi:hypothetical protein ACFLQ8_00565 [Candidatus Auribacterota bacterium]
MKRTLILLSTISLYRFPGLYGVFRKGYVLDLWEAADGADWLQTSPPIII